MMADYRIYRFDGGSRIEMADWIEASDDVDAIRQTHELGRRAAKCELWKDKRLVFVIDEQHQSA